MNSWKEINRPIILASNSPRREEILTQMGVDFSVITKEIEDEESFFNGSNIELSIKTLALAKAEGVAKIKRNSLVIGADTVVQLGGEVLGKPSNSKIAREMIERLSGRSHTVITAVGAICKELNFSQCKLSKTEVFFRKLTKSEIDNYIKGNDYLDKAGAYGIQSEAMSFVDKINGCYYNVVGLPTSVIVELFNNFKKLS